MSDNDKNLPSGKVSLDIEIKDLLNVVSKSGSRPILSEPSSHLIEGEDLKKAWFKHMLSSMEKLNDLIEKVRREDIATLKNDMKEATNKVELKVDKLEVETKTIRLELIGQIEKVEKNLTSKIQKMEAAFDAKEKSDRAELEAYKKEVRDVIDPIKNRVLTITVKLGVWATVAGFAGSGLMALVVYIVKEYFMKPAS